MKRLYVINVKGEDNPIITIFGDKKRAYDYVNKLNKVANKELPVQGLEKMHDIYYIDIYYYNKDVSRYDFERSEI